MCDKNYDKYVDELNKKINKNFNLDDIKQFLDYDDNFWNYIKFKTLYIDSNMDNSKYFYGVLTKIINNTLIDIQVIVPNIIDLKTLLINIHEYTHAHDLYLCIGKSLASDLEYENNARNKELEFIKKKIL